MGRLFFVTVFLALALILAAAAELPAVEPGFAPLFNGKDIEEHFVVKGKRASWEAVDGAIRAYSGGDRLVSKREYGDFVLRLEWRVQTEGNSGVFIRVPSQDDSAPWVSGFEVQVSSYRGETSGFRRDDAHCTGSLYGVEAVRPRPNESADVWHRFEVTCLGGQVSVRADGLLCVDARSDANPEMAKRPRKGFIGLQDFHADDKGRTLFIEYRKLRIQELTSDGTPLGFRSLTSDGKGWHKIQTGHGSGGRWTFAGGAWEGEQDPPGSGNGGVLASDEKLGDFELVIETKPDWGVCSGVFLRSTDRGACYQIMVDWHGGGNVGGIYGEGTGGFNVRNYTLKDDKGIAAASQGGAVPLPFAPEDWKQHWRFDDYNELRARILGNPPAIDVWLNGTHLSHFADTEKRLDVAGHLGIQVHGGKGWPEGAKVRFRRISVRELK
jgi:hypothetical protein